MKLKNPGTRQHDLNGDKHTGNLSESKVAFDNAAGHKHNGTDSTQISYNDLTDQPAAIPPANHSQQHEFNGTDQMNVAGLSGVLADKQLPQAHTLAGADHTSDTLENLNLKISDATLDDVAGTRDPNPHTHVVAEITDFDAEVSSNTDVAANSAHRTGDGTDHANVVLADTHRLGDGTDHSEVAANAAARHTHANKTELDLITDGDHDVRIDNPHGTGIPNMVAGTLAQLNTKVTDATLDDTSGTRDPNPHTHVSADITDFQTSVSANTDVAANSAHRAGDGSDHANVALSDTHRLGNGSDHANVALNDTHRLGDGSDHANVALNDTHRLGNGSDHANVALNDTHRLGDGSDHTHVALNTTHRTSDGTDHTYIDQDVTTTGDPLFNTIKLTPQTTELPHAEGVIYYDNPTKTFVGLVDNPNVRLNIGEESWVRVKNNTAGTLLNGKICYLSGMDGDIPEAAYAKADDPATCLATLGFCTADIAPGQTGRITILGIVRDNDTSSGSAPGALIYLSDTVAGDWTETQPLSPNIPILMGTLGKLDAVTGTINARPPQILADLTIKSNASTGLLYGGEVSISAELPTGTKGDIAAGAAIIVNSYTDAAAPVYRVLQWDAQIGVTLTLLGTDAVFTDVSVRDDGTGNAEFPQRPTGLTREETRDECLLGTWIHPNFTTIAAVSDAARNIEHDTSLRFWDFVRSIGGSVKQSGLTLSSNGANKKFNRSAGLVFVAGGNYSINRKDPNVVQAPSEEPVTFYLGGTLTSIGITVTSDIPTDQYEPNGEGVLAAIPTGWYSAHRVFYDASSGLTAVQYGQHVYDSLKSAVEHHEREPHIAAQSVQNIQQIGSIIVQEGATDLSDYRNNRFVTFGNYGATPFTSVPNIDEFGEPVELLDALTYQRHDIVLREDAGTVYADISAIGGGDVTYIFGQHEYTLDCTTGAGPSGEARIALSTGVDSSSPVKNYIYVTRSGDEAILNVSSSKPTDEYANVGYVYLPDVATFLARGSYAFQRYTEAKAHDGRSIIAIVQESLRVRGAMWDSGVTPTASITGIPNIVATQTTSGDVYQVRSQTFPALDTSIDGFMVANASGSGLLSLYDFLTNLGDCIELNDGTPIPKNRPFNLVLWGAINKTTSECKYYVNLPNKYYATTDAAYRDTESSAVVSVPREIRDVAFLIARIPIMYTDNLAEVWQFIAPVGQPEIISLLGNPVGVSGSGSSSAGTTFSDSTFQLINSLDATRVGEFDLSAITTGTTRTLIWPDKNGTIATTDDIIAPSAHAHTHYQDDTDPIEIINLAAAETDPNKRIAPDELGGINWIDTSDRVALGWSWNFDVTTADADPGSATFRINNASQDLATFLYISNISVSGADMSAILGNFRIGDRLYIQENKDTARHSIFRLTGAPADGTTYWKLPVVSDEYGTAIRDGERCGFDKSFTHDVPTHALDSATHTGTLPEDQVEFFSRDGHTHDGLNSSEVDHASLTSKGTNTHAQIDTHIGDASIHYTEASIDHTAITNIGTNTHAQIDTHIGDSAIHFTEASVDHNSISGKQGGTTDEYYHLTSTEYSNLGDATSIKGILVDDVDIADGKVLAYSSTSGNLEYATVSSFEAALAKTIYVDGERADTYTADGTELRPYKDIQSAIDAIPSPSSTNRYCVYVKNGIYTLTSNLTINKNYMTLVGESRKNTIIDVGAYQITVSSVAVPNAFGIENLTVRSTSSSFTGYMLDINGGGIEGLIKGVDLTYDGGTANDISMIYFNDTNGWLRIEDVYMDIEADSTAVSSVSGIELDASSCAARINNFFIRIQCNDSTPNIAAIRLTAFDNFIASSTNIGANISNGTIVMRSGAGALSESSSNVFAALYTQQNGGSNQRAIHMSNVSADLYNIGTSSTGSIHAIHMATPSGSSTTLHTSGCVFRSKYDGTGGSLVGYAAAIGANDEWYSDSDVFDVDKILHDNKTGLGNGVVLIESQESLPAVDLNAATYSIMPDDGPILSSYSSTGTSTVTIDDDNLVRGRRIKIKDVGQNAEANQITIDTEGAALIDGAASVSINVDGGEVELYCDGTNYIVTSKLLSGIFPIKVVGNQVSLDYTGAVKNDRLAYNGTIGEWAAEGESFEFSIASFTDNEAASVHEIGPVANDWKAISAISFSATYDNGPPSAAPTVQTGGRFSAWGAPLSMTTAPDYEGPTANTDAIKYPSGPSSNAAWIQLSATDGEDPDTAYLYFYFYNNRYWGVDSSTSLDESGIKGLSNSELSNSRAKTFTVTAAAGEYIWYCYPTRLGTATFTVGGFAGGFESPLTVSVTNSKGYTENYYAYRSTNSGLGTTTVVVS